ncbi:MAG: sugar ABC transporter permease [Sulfobacillus acidophilus]|uniref:Sugar ABC transporter permease n=1 Tax=Sulfobacillus acidophilus TaxID=53633 RepID=A0A2T2WFW0_9FIRM|nr:MAG: sugar ABC transporter permease [Sulfobacillus acidophilus]
MRTERGLGENVRTALVYAVLIVIAVAMLIPFLWMLGTAFKSSSQVNAIPIIWLPWPLHFGNIVSAWTSVPFGRFFVNTFVVAIASTIGQIITSVLAGYAFARMRFRGKQVLFLLTLATLMIPFQVILIPTFLIIKHLGLVNTLWALILPNLATGFGVFLLRQFFLQIPTEMEEAATIDGAGRWRIMAQIMVPLARPAVATLSVFTFLWAWNSYLWPLIVLNSPTKMTIQVGLSYFQGAHVGEYNVIMAGSFLSLIPIVILFLITQRQLVAGIVAGAVKG